MTTRAIPSSSGFAATWADLSLRRGSKNKTLLKIERYRTDNLTNQPSLGWSVGVLWAEWRVLLRLMRTSVAQYPIERPRSQGGGLGSWRADHHPKSPCPGTRACVHRSDRPGALREDNKRLENAVLFHVHQMQGLVHLIKYEPMRRHGGGMANDRPAQPPHLQVYRAGCERRRDFLSRPHEDDGGKYHPERQQE